MTCSFAGRASIAAAAAFAAAAIACGSTPTSTCGPTRVTAGGLAGPAVAPTSSCVRPVGPSTLDPARIIPLGVHSVGEVVTFQLPPGTASVTLLSQGEAAVDTVTFQGTVIPNGVVPDQLVAPVLAKIYDDNVMLTPDESVTAAWVFYGGAPPWTGTMTLPNNTGLLSIVERDGQLPPGSWSFLVNDYAYECATIPSLAAKCTGGATSGRYDLTVLTKRGPIPGRGTIDLAIFLVAAGTVTSGSAPNDPDLQRMVKSVSSLLAASGICVGSVTYFDLPQWAQDKFATGVDADKSDACSNLSQMLTLSRPGNTMNLFLVESISSTSAGGMSVVGVDGTIPGPASVGGTIASGAAVSIADLRSKASPSACSGDLAVRTCGADEVAYIAAHETGHFLGLYHTTEATGDFYDGLSDTPRCVCDQCVSASRVANCASNNPPSGTTPTEVNGQDCSGQKTDCGGADNLMFWLLSSQAAGHLTKQQGEVARLNPTLH